MKSIFALAGFICACLVGGGWAIAADQSQETAAIQRLELQQQDAWNHHDANAYAQLFTQDCNVVNVLGWWWKGRAELSGKLSDAFAFVFAESRLAITSVDVRFPAPSIAFAHVRWTMTGARNPTAGPASHAPMMGIQTQVLSKASGSWLIADFQNTNSIPETPFPTGK
ncbi:MAG TPA: SgcJ/EcaC family oxidoreductase [Candidatus Cybelea sp.]